VAKERGSDDTLRENPLVTQLIARCAETAMILRGSIGPAAREGRVRVYPRLQNLSDSIEIAREDILHSVEAPQSALGAVILWVNKDAKISIHRVGVSEPIGSQVENPVNLRKGPVSPQHENLVELRKGRLRMRVRPPKIAAFSEPPLTRCAFHIAWTAFLCEVA
jgi:hypothetical protein